MNFAKQISKKVIRTFGYEVKRLGEPVKSLPVRSKYPLNLSDGLMRARKHGVSPATVIDVGASDGRWSLACEKFFPNASYFLIEANPLHEPGLKEYRAGDPKRNYVLAAAGDQVGEIHFSSFSLFGGAASYQKHPVSSQIVPMTSIDAQVREKNLAAPFLIKLDTHGFEREILGGARDTFADTALFIIEAHNFVKTPNHFRFHELCAFMESKQFRCIDLVEPMFRPDDEALWQMDLFFMPSNHPVFRSNSYGNIL